MSQRARGGKNVTQVKGNDNHINVKSFDVNILSGFDNLITSFLGWLKKYFQKDAVIADLRKEIQEKNFEIARLRDVISGKLDKMLEANQAILDSRKIIEKVFKQASSSGYVDHTSYSLIKELLDEYARLQDEDEGIRACTMAGLWVAERTELWITEAVNEVIKSRSNLLSCSQELIHNDLRKYLVWLSDSLLIYAQPHWSKLDEINQERSISSPLIYREALEYIQAKGDFGRLHSDEIYWLQTMIQDLIDNL